MAFCKNVVSVEPARPVIAGAIALWLSSQQLLWRRRFLKQTRSNSASEGKVVFFFYEDCSVEVKMSVIKMKQKKHIALFPDAHVKLWT